MRLILLFLNLFFIESFNNVIFSKMQMSSSNELEINTSSNKRKHKEPSGVSNSLKRRIRKKYDGGFDQRELGKTCLEQIYDQVQEKQTLEKLRKYSYQMNLLQKLKNCQIGELEKIKAIEEYNYVMESSKYTHNSEAGGLYKNWSNNDF